MAVETVEAKLTLKDAAGNVVLDDEGKPSYNSASVEYNFGDTLDDAVDACGAETVFSNYRANARVALQGIIRAKLKAGMDQTTIQSVVDTWKPGMVMERTAVDPEQAIKSAFATWSPEKQAEFLRNLGVSA